MATSRPGVLAREQPATTARKPIRQALLDNAPWMPPHWDLADAAALQALQRGEASADQQLRVLKWWVNQACAIDDMSYRPGGEEGRRDTDFAEGRRFPGLQTMKLLHVSLASLQRRDPNADPAEPKS